MHIRDMSVTIDDGVVISMRVIDTNGAGTVRLSTRYRVDEQWWTQATSHEKALFARNACLQMLSHELDECFLVNGKRLFDPHRKETT